MTPHTFNYGRDDHQAGDLSLPGAARPPVVCLLHGGFWRMPHGRAELAPVARDLCLRGFAVWNLEYRRLGAPGGGWPGTLQDVGAGIDHLATLAADGIGLDLDRVAVVGHSAGGQLALWSARGDAARANGHGPRRVGVAAAVGLAPVVDLARAHALGLGNGAVAAFLGGSPAQHPQRYRAASPVEFAPGKASRMVMHGARDDVVPVEMSRQYACEAGDAVHFVELAEAGHMDFVDPDSQAHAALVAWLEAFAQSRRG